MSNQVAVRIPYKPRSAERLWADMGKNSMRSKETVEWYDRHASGGDQSSSDRTVNIQIEGSDETLIIACKTSTTVAEVAEQLRKSLGMRCDHNQLRFKSKIGRYWKIQLPSDEIARKVVVSGIRSFKRETHRYEHPLLVIGGGLGGIQTMIKLIDQGRQDFVCVERLHDFGGHSWMVLANQSSKLHTEVGTYHANYIRANTLVAKRFGCFDCNAWPSRDELLTMFRNSAREHGLHAKTMFNTSVEQIVVKGNSLAERAYACRHQPVNMLLDYIGETQAVDDSDGGLLKAGAVIAWPGNFGFLREVELRGEKEFDGCIVYGYNSRVDYSRAEGARVIIYGHGAFAIENVRTLVEHRCNKVYIVCRSQNLCCMKVVSWLVAQTEVPVPCRLMLELFQPMYDLIGFDVCNANAVKTDSNGTSAMVDQKAPLGVSDIYFLAGYYGLMEIVVDELQRLSRRCAHCVHGGRKIDNVDMIVKALGAVPNFKVDELLHLKELVGVWVNADPLRSVSCDAMHVQTRSFGSFSSCPVFSRTIAAIAWFIDYPDDMSVVLSHLPRQMAVPGNNGRPAYVPGPAHLSPMFLTLQALLPLLGQQLQMVDAIKSEKHRLAHPLEKFLADCRAEWEMHSRIFKEAGMIETDREEPEYPYTLEMVVDTLRVFQNRWQ